MVSTRLKTLFYIINASSLLASGVMAVCENDGTTLRTPFTSLDVLRVAVTDYVTSSGQDSYLAATYGYPIGCWDVSQMTSMMSLFMGLSSFNEPLNDWDVSRVTNMNLMFFNVMSFDQPLNSWDVSKVERASYMFGNAISFNQQLDSWQFHSAQDLQRMFDGATKFNQNLCSWRDNFIEDFRDESRLTNGFRGTSCQNRADPVCSEKEEKCIGPFCYNCLSNMPTTIPLESESPSESPSIAPTTTISSQPTTLNPSSLPPIQGPGVLVTTRRPTTSTPTILPPAASSEFSYEDSTVIVRVGEQEDQNSNLSIATPIHISLLWYVLPLLLIIS
jgi:surface protein